jgi:hypothetical protein
MKLGQPSLSALGLCLILETKNGWAGPACWRQQLSPVPESIRRPPWRDNPTQSFLMPQHWPGMLRIVTMKKEKCPWRPCVQIRASISAYRSDCYRMTMGPFYYDVGSLGANPEVSRALDRFAAAGSNFLPTFMVAAVVSPFRPYTVLAFLIGTRVSVPALRSTSPLLFGAKAPVKDEGPLSPPAFHDRRHQMRPQVA